MTSFIRPSTPVVIRLPTCAAYEAFSARCKIAGAALASGLRRNYYNFFAGMQTDGLVDDNGGTSLFDFIFFFATQNNAAASINLIGSSSYSITEVGSPTFTANQGYTGGTAGNSTVYLTCNYTVTAAGTLATQNNAHMSVWCNNDINNATDQIAMGTSTTSFGQMNILPRDSGGKADYRIFDTGGGSAGVTTADSVGFYAAVRTSGSAQKGYKNASDQSVASVGSQAISTALVILGFRNSAGMLGYGYSGQISACSFGKSLSATQVSNLYSRLGTFRTAVGL